MVPAVSVTVELFGNAKLLAGRREVDIAVPGFCGIQALASSLAEVVPCLVGGVVRKDEAGLMGSYVFNLNGTRFLEGGVVALKPGDRILLFSSQAGG